MRYFPPSGTAGLARSFVNGNKRVPAPPPIMMASVCCVVPGGRAGADIAGLANVGLRRGSFWAATPAITQRPSIQATFLLLYHRVAQRQTSQRPVATTWRKR